ncbi:hypothetical protein ACN28I_17485 [Archangium gephyra]|uniref:hypothetical protein n=1 Tax=Archangium gephyra TaxID=48 RepID=UPI003B7A9DD3
MQELLQSFGEPAERTSPDGEEMVLDYWREKAPEGTRGARFRISMENGLLQRIDVFPETPPTREALEEQFGPPCVKAGKAAGKVRTPGAKAGGKKVRKPVSCYEVKVTPGNRVYFHYARSGLAVFFEGQRVHSLAYLVPPRPGRGVRKQPPLEEPPELPAPVLAAAEPAPAEEPPPAPAPSPTEVAANSPTSAAGNEPGATEEPDPFSTAFRPVTVSQAAVEQTGPTDEPSAGPASEPASRTTTELPPAMSAEKENFLTLGGLFYQRIDVLGSRLGGTTSARPSLPALVNLYMDAKPSESLRGFVVGRLVYDPLNAAGAGPQAVLDQLWFRFDIASRVFITAGRQQIKWGSSLIWNPTDFLQSPNQQPLEGIDLRLGVDMLKVNIPWEAMASNLTLLVTADLNGPGEDKLRYGAAGRADIALGNFGEAQPHRVLPAEPPPPLRPGLEHGPGSARSQRRALAGAGHRRASLAAERRRLLRAQARRADAARQCRRGHPVPARGCLPRRRALGGFLQPARLHRSGLPHLAPVHG